MLKENF